MLTYIQGVKWSKGSGLELPWLIMPGLRQSQHGTCNTVDSDLASNGKNSLPFSRVRCFHDIMLLTLLAKNFGRF